MLLMLPVSADARFRRQALPVHVRLVAYVGDKVEGTQSELTWTVSSGKKKYKLQVVSLLVNSGNTTALEIESAVSPYSTQFQLSGPKELMQRFESTPPGQQMTILAYVRIDSTRRSLILSAIEPGAEGAPLPG